MFKKSFVVFLSVLLMCVFFSSTTAVVAGQGAEASSEDHVVTPMWTYIDSFYNYFGISDSGKATVEVMLDSVDADEIRLEAKLQQYKNGSWTTIKTWTNSRDWVTCYISENWYVASGYSYRLVSTGKVYKNGVMVEQTTYTSDSEYY